MRIGLLDPVCTTATTSVEALHDDRLADKGLSHHQRVHIEIVVVFGISNCRLERLLYRTCNALTRKFQVGKRARYLLAADKRGNKVQLLRADADRAKNRTSQIGRA